METNDLIKFLAPLASLLGKFIQWIKRIPKKKREQSLPQITITGNTKTTVNIIIHLNKDV